MKRIRRATHDEVVAFLCRTRDTLRGPARWTLPLIDVATRQFGKWELVSLDGVEAAAIVLPPHSGEPCHGDTMTLVEAGGATVAETAQKLATFEGDYARANRSCWHRIDEASCAPFSRLILTTAPLAHADYRSLRSRGTLFHLDGLHRLVGWARRGRLGDARLEAWVAGPTHHFVRRAEPSEEDPVGVLAVDEAEPGPKSRADRSPR